MTSNRIDLRSKGRIRQLVRMGFSDLEIKKMTKATDQDFAKWVLSPSRDSKKMRRRIAWGYDPRHDRAALYGNQRYEDVRLKSSGGRRMTGYIPGHVQREAVS